MVDFARLVRSSPTSSGAHAAYIVFRPSLIVAVLSRPDLVHLAVRDQKCLLRLVAELYDHIARREFLLHEAIRERGEHMFVLETTKQR
jgi:hypothetical protein